MQYLSPFARTDELVKQLTHHVEFSLFCVKECLNECDMMAVLPRLGHCITNTIHRQCVQRVCMQQRWPSSNSLRGANPLTNCFTVHTS